MRRNGELNTNLLSIWKGVCYFNVTAKKTFPFLYKSYHLTSFTFTYKDCEIDHKMSKAYYSVVWIVKTSYVMQPSLHSPVKTMEKQLEHLYQIKYESRIIYTSNGTDTAKIKGNWKLGLTRVRVTGD